MEYPPNPKEDAKEKVKDLENKFSKCGKYSILVTEIETDREETFRTSKNLVGNKRIVILFGIDGRISVIGSSDPKAPVNMSYLVKETCKILGGGGGGNKDFAQGAGFNKNKLGDAKKWVKEQIEAKLI